MECNKLKIKVGDHEFEAEGPPDVVQKQFDAFKELVLSTPASRKIAQPPGEEGEPIEVTKKVPASLQLEKIMRVEGRVVSLTARAPSIGDAILLVILGQKHFRDNDGITGSEILDGLRQSGQAADRIDRTLKKMASDGHIIKLGAHRASRYRMTNQGIVKAQEIARNVISLVA